ncbi:hypothetical protein [Streptomyces sp. NPDC055210]
MTDVIKRIRGAVTEHRLPDANLAVAELKRMTSDLFGADHPHMFEALALDAYVAHLQGDHERSTAISLDLAERRFSAGDKRAVEEIERAAATWELLRQPHSAVPLGNRLVSLWGVIFGAEESGLVGIESVEARLSAYARVAAPRFAANMGSFSDPSSN